MVIQFSTTKDSLNESLCSTYACKRSALQQVDCSCIGVLYDSDSRFKREYQ